MTEEQAATMVQSTVRGSSERKQRQKEVTAATTVQAHLKGRSLRRSLRTASNVRVVSDHIRTASNVKAVLARLFAGGGLQASKVALVDRKPKACSQWLQDNWGLFKGIAHVRLLLVVLWAAVVVAIKEHVVDEFAEDEDEVFPLLSSPASRSGVGVLGSLLAFALVFRTSICYTRWWEARRLPSPNARRHSPATPVSWHLPTPRARPRLPPSVRRRRAACGG